MARQARPARRSLALAVLPVLALASPARAEEPLESLIASRAPAVVNVKFVMKTSLSFGGQSQDQESTREVRGVCVDASGLVMFANSHLEAMGRFGGGRRGGRGGGLSVKAAANDFKVLFGNESTEHDAVLVARDSTLGLAYVALADAAKLEKPPAAVDLSKGAEPRIGQTLFGVTRKNRGFDCAPMLDRMFVNGVVEKPRRMWSIAGSVEGVGLPAYDASGAAVGVVSSQSGSEGVEAGGGGNPFAFLEGGESGTFVLPLDAVARSIDAAKKRAPEALAKAKEGAEEKSSEDAPKDGGSEKGEKPPRGAPGTGEPGMDPGTPPAK